MKLVTEHRSSKGEAAQGKRYPGTQSLQPSLTDLYLLSVSRFAQSSPCHKHSLHWHLEGPCGNPAKAVVSEFNPLTFTSVIECEKPNNDLSRFRGCM
ncbi:hypothetical protein MC885_013301 [Smutsia gigantea]|nr:hypothetical protein MC885_013301 [Smutsia gigantea]